MKALILFTALAIAAGPVALRVSGHHSTNSMYDEARTVEVTGKVLEWQFVNPHPYLVVEMAAANGRLEKWDLSFGGSAVSHLTARGFTKTTFKVGETVIARGAPARSESVRGILIRGNVTRPDGSRIP
jgi:hypothetical protein